MHIARLLVLVLVAAAVLGVCARQVPLAGRRSHSSSMLAEVDSSAQAMLEAEAEAEADLDMDAEAEAEVDAGADLEALPGEQCFSSHDALEPSGEASSTLYSYNSFCSRSSPLLALPLYHRSSPFVPCQRSLAVRPLALFPNEPPAPVAASLRLKQSLICVPSCCAVLCCVMACCVCPCRCPTVSVVEHLADPYANEKEFREACNDKFGIDKCRHQCRELAVRARTHRMA